MALLQIHLMPLGQGLPSPATLMFSRQVCGIMPVLDCKPLIKDCDDSYHNKLVERQQKSINDASAIFPCIPIGSAVAVQHDDGRPWTHGTIVGMGNHNHHDKSYMIQLMTNGRHITHNRCHIKPTTVMVDTYMQYHSTKQQNARAGSLADILNNITKIQWHMPLYRHQVLTIFWDNLIKNKKRRQRTKNNIALKQQIAAGKQIQMLEETRKQ